MPNGQAQQRLIERALSQAQIEPHQISYLEAHGTGTSLGDPIEVNAATSVLGKDRSPEQPLWIGSVKTNIGHLEAAAGVSGLIKVILSMQHQQLPPHLHLQKPNPKIDWQPWLQVPKSLTPWTVSDSRLAGVSSFGFTGTNAHVVLEEAPLLPSTSSQWERPIHLLKLSAKSDKALSELASRLSQHLKNEPTLALEDICFTANTGRLSHSHRLAIVAESTTEMQAKLHAFTTNSEAFNLVSGVTNGSQPPKIAMLFTGQGSQYVGMGRQLYETQPSFKKSMERCAEILDIYLDRPLLDILYSDTDDAVLAQTAYTQPALFALEYSLYQLWLSWGIKPDVVIGHSVGEYVAACVAEVFSLEDGLKLIAARGRLMQQLPSGGAMVSLLASVTQVKEFIVNYPEIAIAAINGPESTVISGSAEAIATVVAKMEAAGIKAKTLQVSHAFHSSLMKPMLPEFEQIAGQIDYSLPKLKLISNVTGEAIASEVATAEYWCRHILSPVNFAAGMETLDRQNCQIFLECGAKPILLGMGRQCLPDNVGVWLPSLRFEQDDWQQMLASLAELYVRGVKVDWRGFDRDYPQRAKVVLPTYPFQRESYWVETKQLTPQKSHSSASSRVTELLSRGDIDKLTELLTKNGRSSVDREILERLVKLHQQPDLSSVQDLIYQLEWIAAEPLEVSQNTESRHWLIFARSGGLAAALIDRLQGLNQTCSLITWENSNPDTGLTSIYTLPAEPSPTAFDALWSQLRSLDSISGIIWLESATDVDVTDIRASALADRVNSRCQSLLLLMQSMAKQPQLDLTKLWVVTQNAVAVGANLPALDRGAVWGLSRIFGLEHPMQWGGAIDLDGHSVTERARSIALEVLANQTEEQVAYRDSSRFVARLTQGSPQQQEPLSISSEGSYLVSGGLGGLGLTVAQWLAERGAKHLLLLSRSGANTADKQSTVSQLKAAGVEVLTPLVDVSDEESLATVLSNLPDAFLPLRGVVHAAGIEGGNYSLAELEPDVLRQTLRPKVRGTWNLHQLTLNWKLDFFVNFSSIAAVWGSARQAHYGAANEFQNLFAQYRQALGMPVLTINWSAIAGAGIIERAGDRTVQQLSQLGIQTLSLDLMTAALELLVGNEQGQRVVASVDWQKLDAVYQARRSRRLLAKLVEQKEVNKPNFVEQLETLTEPETSINYFDKLQAATPEKRQEAIATYLQSQIAKVLGFKNGRLPAIDRNLLQVGMDSLMMMQVLSQLKQDLQLTVYPREFYDRPCIEDLAAYLATEFTRMHGGNYTEAKQSSVTVLGIPLKGSHHRSKIPSRPGDRPKLSGMTFILSPPRSGSTLLRVMLAGHPALFSPPELHLLPFVSMGERAEKLSATYLQEGLQKALMELMELDANNSASLVRDLESKNLSIYEMYALLQERAGNRLLVDKSPTYALELEILQRAEEIFQGAKYIHLTRHPYASIESFAQLRLDKLFGAEQSNPYRMAEQFWVRSHQNIIDFSRQVEPERYHLVRYEDLVQQPQPELERLCQFLNIPFVPELLQPYEGKRMVKGVHEFSAPIGDPNFFSHQNIEASLAETWKHIQLPHLLTQEAREIADRLKYVLPREEVLLQSNVDDWEEIEL